MGTGQEAAPFLFLMRSRTICFNETIKINWSILIKAAPNLLPPLRLKAVLNGLEKRYKVDYTFTEKDSKMEVQVAFAFYASTRGLKRLMG